MCSKGGTLLNRKEMFNRCMIPTIFMKNPSTASKKTKPKSKNKSNNHTGIPSGYGKIKRNAEI